MISSSDKAMRFVKFSICREENARKRLELTSWSLLARVLVSAVLLNGKLGTCWGVEVPEEAMVVMLCVATVLLVQNCDC
jgi:hypothetical protein